ncbi:phage integrase family protein [Undibacterium sp. RTI2.1]|uniref:phage integrase family protein n=1 Tax=unclassified Undibacterium TaxID=2630295 RepID=UPI002B2249F1|nr:MULTISPECIES: phage integrase family protein [unclassified Undibacterium]MEB0032289.1 phage integrase family protein [Undibacterium sp. RTI2.1]MEB0118432.1 phage integrase family protein [Undibacterium sp. RTI2.2]
MARPIKKKTEPGLEATLVLERVGRHHLAFLKGYLEGLDLGKIAKQYLENFSEDDHSIDLRVARSTLDWIRAELKLVAKRFGKSSMARVIMINPEQLVTVAAKIPTLEQFREERDPYEMYSESDLIELFQEAYSDTDTNSKAQRNIRLRQRQSDALLWLHDMAVTDPNRMDNVASWLKANVAKKLIRAGVNTLEELVEAININGYRWYSAVPGLGEITARSIVKWLTLNEAALTCSFSRYSLTKRSELNIVELKKERPKIFGIVPIEYFKPRQDLDGSTGHNRGERNKSGAENDFEAIQVWLSTFEKDSNTYLSYRNQVERFLLWSILELGKPLSSLDTKDCIAYRDFLWDLGRMYPETWNTVYRIPESSWLGKRNTERWSLNWRPFEELKSPKPPKEIPPLLRKQWQIEHTSRNGVLKLSSQRLAVIICSSMCAWLTKRHYLDSNPWDGIKPRMAQQPEIAVHHSLTQTQWAFILQYLEHMEPSSSKERLKFILVLGYMTGIRLSEMANASKGDLEYRIGSTDDSSGWILNVVGKGKRPRAVPFPSVCMNQLIQYFAHRGYGGLDAVPEEVPLIDFLMDSSPHLNKLNAIDDKRKTNGVMAKSQIYRSLVRFFKSVAKEFAKISPEGAKHLTMASTHWLRHTSATHAIASGVPIEIVKLNFGHQSIATTGIYITPEMERRVKVMEEFGKAVSTRKRNI